MDTPSNKKPNDIYLGTSVGPVVDVSPTTVTCLDPALSRHARTPWMRAHLNRDHGLSIVSTVGPVRGEVRVPLESFVHLLAVGPSGGGKTRALLVILAALLAYGFSVVALDVKMDTLIHLIDLAFQAGVPAERITLLDPACRDFVPGINPFASDLAPQAIASDFMSVFESTSPAGGARMLDTLANALAIIIAHKKSIRELIAFLVDENYRSWLLGQPLPAPASGEPNFAALEAVRFWRYEVARWSRAEVTAATAVIVRRLREWVRNPFLRPLLSAERDTLQVEGLYHRQGIVAAHLDASLGSGATLLAGQLVSLAYRSALRSTGRNPTVLLLDEASFSARMVGDVLGDVLAVARSYRLHLMVACQHTGQLPDRLVESLLVNSSVKLFFRQTEPKVATALAARANPQVERLTLEPERGGAAVHVLHRICDGYGTPLRLSDRSWAQLVRATGRNGNRLDTFLGMARQSGVRLYLHAADTNQPVALDEYVRGVPRADLGLDGPSLRLRILFPRPRIKAVERLSEAEVVKAHLKTLAELPNQHAVVEVLGRSCGIVRLADMPDPLLDRAFSAYLTAVRRAGGQSAVEVAAIEQRRSAEIDGLATTPFAGDTESSDGSL